jgi:hypothetical protein
VQELKLPKPEEPKWIMVVRSRRTRIDILCISGGSTLGESEGREFETPKARIAEVACGRRSVGGTCQ